jgi:HD-like signal output (HDOD) protein
LAFQLSNKCNLLQGNVGIRQSDRANLAGIAGFRWLKFGRTGLWMIAPDEFLAAQVMKGTVLVPPYPAVALRVQELLQTPSFTMGELSQLVASDPALALRVLAIANSAANRPASGPIGSIESAVARVGVSQVAELALAAALAEGACADGPLVRYRFLAWRKSLASAFLAQEIAGVRGQRKGEGFLMGLLWDFGLAVCLATLEPALAAGRVRGDLAPVAIMGAAERFQREVSRRIADKWALPEPYRRALTEDLDNAKSDLGKVGQDGSRVARLVETFPAVTDKMLTALLPASSERQRVLAFLPALPESIAALGPQTQGAPKLARAQSPASQAKPDLSNRGRNAEPSSGRPGPASAGGGDGTWLPVTIRKGTETFTGSLGLVSESSAVLMAPKPLSSNWITEITLEEGGLKESFWVRVDKTVAEAGKSRVHVAPYGLDAAKHERWVRLSTRFAANA